MFNLLRFFSFIPAWLMSLLGWLLGWLTFLLSSSYRQNFISNAKQAGYSFRQVRAAVGQAGRMVTELPKVLTGRLATVHMDAATQQVVDASRETGRGILFLVPHLGCFEASSQSVAQRFGPSRGPFVVLYRPSRKPWIAKGMLTIRNRYGQKAVPTDISGVRAMLKTLRKGGSVGMLPDQVPPFGMGIWSKVFGKPAYTMTIAARLMQQVTPIVLVGRCERLSWGRGYQLYLKEMPYNPAYSEEDLVLQINQAIQEQICACPQQYLWAYARYKRPRGMPAESAPTEEEK